MNGWANTLASGPGAKSAQGVMMTMMKSRDIADVHQGTPKAFAKNYWC